jgi:predicted alpha/beta hydrolase family esterase
MNMPNTPPARAADAVNRSRLVIVPGLHGSGAQHWQSWLEDEIAGSARVVQDDWGTPDLERWSERVAATLAALGPGPHAVVAHSFGCLATVRAARRDPSLGIGRMLLVAPAEPTRFDVAHALPQTRLAIPSCVVASDNDPWMSATQAHAWALRWGSDWINLGNAGHINVDSGYGPFPLTREWAAATLARLKSVDAASWRAAA